MSSDEWKVTTLGDIAQIIMGQSPAGEFCNDNREGIPLLNGPTEFSSYHPNPVQYTTDPKKVAEKGDLLFCVRGSTTGRMNWADRRYAIGRGLASLRHIKGSAFQPFLRGILEYYLPSLLAEATGSTFPNVSSQQLNQLAIKVPSDTEQKIIADILKSFDDKIELNRQTNQTLEAIAQAIYKEWFVNFNFPTSPLEGWQAKPDGVDSFLRPCPKAVDSLQATPTSPASWQKNSLFPFWTLPKNHKLQERAKELRKQGILSEVVFWKTFKDKKKLGWDIDRQVIIGNFIVDFFIPELGLVFEIDGSSHNDKQEYDHERDAFLSSLQLKVIRIFGKDVLGNIEGVWSFVTRSIKERVKELSPPRPSGTPQEGKSPPRQASPATPQEGKKCEMQDSEFGLIPKGWMVVTLGEITDLTWGDTNTTKKSYVNDGYPAFSASGRDGFLPYYDFDRDGIVVSAIGAYAGKTWFATGKWSCIKNTIRFWSVNPQVSNEYLYLATSSPDFWPLRGSAQPFISQTDARNLKVLFPNPNESEKFSILGTCKRSIQ